MSYDPILVCVAADGASDFLDDLPRASAIYKMLIVTWDSSIDTNLAYGPEGDVICSGDIGSILRLAEKQHYEMIVMTWPDLFLALRDPRGSLS